MLFGQSGFLFRGSRSDYSRSLGFRVLQQDQPQPTSDSVNKDDISFLHVISLVHERYGSDPLERSGHSQPIGKASRHREGVCPGYRYVFCEGSQRVDGNMATLFETTPLEVGIVKNRLIGGQADDDTDSFSARYGGEGYGIQPFPL